jgi:hypothetical protein
VLGLLDLRERGERLEPSRFAADPTVTETVGEILGRVRAEGDHLAEADTLTLFPPLGNELPSVRTDHVVAMDARKDQR